MPSRLTAVKQKPKEVGRFGRSGQMVRVLPELFDKFRTLRQTVKQEEGRQTSRSRLTDDSESNNAKSFCSYSKIRFFSHFRWSRQQAVDFMVENTAMSLHNVNTEVDRYIIWPGQVGSCFPLPYVVQFLLSTWNRRC